MKRNLLITLAALAVIAPAGISGNAQTKTTRLAADAATKPAHQPFSDFRGVRLGMNERDVRARLGQPTVKDTDMDYFVLSENLMAQVAYDTSRQVRAISIDYTGAVGAPDHQTVVGSELEGRPDGSAYKQVTYDAQGFWVSYNRTAGPMVVVTITIQKMHGR
jgi:hypothetical protein